MLAEWERVVAFVRWLSTKEKHHQSEMAEPITHSGCYWYTTLHNPTKTITLLPTHDHGILRHCCFCFFDTVASVSLTLLLLFLWHCSSSALLESVRQLHKMRLHRNMEAIHHGHEKAICCACTFLAENWKISNNAENRVAFEEWDEI